MAEKYISVPFEQKDIQETGKFTGYGSTFGGKPDSYGDIIAPGAFSNSIVKNGRGGLGIAMLYQHDHAQPIGVWNSIVQDSKGLLMEGQLALKTQRGSETYELLKMGALKGLSIGFDMPRINGKVDPNSYEIDEKNNTRLLKDIDLWEVSPVTFAANTRARVTRVKSLEDAKTEREMEKILRDSGLSKSDSVYLASLCKSGLRDSGTDQVKEILETLNTVIIKIKKDPVSEILETLNFVNGTIKNNFKMEL